MEKRFERKIKYIPFDPEIELEKIKKISDLKERKEKLRDFKYKLFEQKRGIAKLMTELAIKIRQNPNLEPSYFYDLVDSRAVPLKLTDKQIHLFKKGIDRYWQRRLLIKRYKKEMLSGVKLFKARTGELPRGEIDIQYSLVTINLFFSDFSDYALFVTRKKGPKAEREASEFSGICVSLLKYNLYHGLVVTNPKLKDEQLRKTLVHEEQHAIWSILKPGNPWLFSLDFVYKKIRANRDRTKINDYLREYYHALLEYCLSNLADEIIAHYKEKHSLPIIFNIVKKYYLKDEKKNISKFEADLKKIVGISYYRNIRRRSKETIKKLKKKIKEMILAISLLESSKYTCQDIINLLITEEPNKWLKWARRLTQKYGY